MARKGLKAAGYKECICNKCGAVAHSTANTIHRRCSGNPDQPNPRSRGQNIPSEARGTWE